MPPLQGPLHTRPAFAGPMPPPRRAIPRWPHHWAAAPSSAYLPRPYDARNRCVSPTSGKSTCEKLPRSLSDPVCLQQGVQASNQACGRCFKYCPRLSEEHQFRGWVRGEADKAGFIMGQSWGKMLPWPHAPPPGAQPPPGMGIMVQA